MLKHSISWSFRSLLIFLLTYTQAFGGSPVIWNGTRGKNLTSKGFLLSDNSVIDNDGALNYIKNGTGEVSTTGWTPYIDAAGTTPVNCFTDAGSPTETVTRTTTTPLVGAGSLLLTKDAVNRQGEGLAYPFTLDNAYKGGPVSITMLTNASASYAASDIGIYIYDVTNSTLITPSAVNIAASGYQYQAFFIASGTSTSYRLCVHTQTANAAAYTLYLDSVYVGPATTVSGAAYQDWTSFTPSYTGLTSTSLNTGWWRRVGDSMEIYTVATSSGAVGAQITLTIPNSLTIDSTKTGTLSTVNLGSAIAYDSSAGTIYNGFVAYNSSTTVDIGTIGSFAKWDGSTPMTWASPDRLSLRTLVPISQWTSNTILANKDLSEFASNSSTTDANDTSSFVSGSVGSLIPTITATASAASRDKTVQFQTPIQATDRIVIEIQKAGTGGWVPLENSVDYSTPAAQSSSRYGIGWTYSTTTQIIVNFFRSGAYGGTGAYSAAGANYPTNASDRWRVRKVTGGSIGYPVSSANVVVPYNSTFVSDSIKGGTWTPTFSGLSGVGDVTAVAGYYHQIGSLVECTMVVTAGSATDFGNGDSFLFSLPIAPDANFGNSYELAGTGYSSATSITVAYGLTVAADIAGSKLGKVTARGDNPAVGTTHTVKFVYRLR